MTVTCVHVFVKEEYIDDFIYESKLNHEGAVLEPGNLRFDVLQDSEDPTKFLLYEAYDSEEAAKNHKETPHYSRWKEKVADWMKEPRKGMKYNVFALKR